VSEPLGTQPLLSEPEPFHKRHRRWLIGWGIAAAFVLFVGIANLGAGDTQGSPETETPADDRAPYAEVACEDFTREAGMQADDGETSNITESTPGDIYTVQMYDDNVRVGTCVVQSTGPEEWTLVKISGH
jgi:hypothetical protein